MPGAIPQTSFNLGEVDPELYHRVDSESYHQACKELENFVVTSNGTALKRNGTSLLLDVTTEAGTSPTARRRLIEGTISSDSNYSLDVLILLVEDVANIGIIGTGTPTLINVVLTGFTADQAQEATFVPVQSDIIVLHPDVPFKRIVYDGTTFTFEDYTIASPAVADLGKVNYTSGAAGVSLLSGVSYTIALEVASPGPNFTFDWMGGIVIGPGASPTSPMGIGLITQVLSGAVPPELVVTSTTPFGVSTGLTLLGNQFEVKQPLFTTALGYPSTATYYQDRLWFAGYKRLPVTLFGTRLGKADNFYIGAENLPEDAIIYRMESEKLGEILHMHVGKHLQVFTSRAACSVPEDDSVGLTNKTFRVKRQAEYGISALAPPTNYQNDTFFAGANGRSIYQYSESGGLESSYRTDLITQFSSHLINSPKKMTTFFSQDQNTSHVIVLNTDNTVAVYSLNESMKVTAWTPFSFSDQIDILDMAKAADEVHFLTSNRRNERHTIVSLGFDTLLAVDAGVPVSLVANPNVNPIVMGLGTLEGNEIVISNGITALGTYTVLNGLVTLDKPLLHDFVGFAGFNYVPKLTPLDFMGEPGAAFGYKSPKSIFINYNESLAIKVGTTTVPYQNFEEIRLGDTIQPKSGTYEYRPLKGWGRYSNFTITQDAPVKLHITGIAYTLKEGSL
jgi:hypothetical protein